MILSPNYFAGFFETSLGKILVAVSVVLEVIGFTFINKIVNIKM
jgi:tight adherence protein B